MFHLRLDGSGAVVIHERLRQFRVVQLFTEKLSVGFSSIEAVVHSRSHDGYHLPLRPCQRRRSLHERAKEGTQSNQEPRIETGNFNDIWDSPPRPARYPIDPTQ